MKKILSQKQIALALPAIIMVCLVGGFFVLAIPALAATSGPNNAAAGANVNGPGTKAWTNAGNVIADDTSYATVELTPGSNSEYLQSTNYGFAIPSGATINGIQVSIMRKSSSNLIGNSINDEDLHLLKGGVIVGNDKATGTDWPTTMASANYGGAADLWGTTWTPAEINAADFGVALSAHAQSILLDRTASVDYIQITVYYTITDTVPPIIVGTPSDMTVEATGAAGAAVAYLTPTATDDIDGTDPVTCVPASGSTFPLGVTTVTCNASDAAGNAATPTSFTVTVQDTTVPVIDSHSDLLVEAASAGGTDVSYTTPNAVDLVDGIFVATCAPASGSTFPLGVTTVTCNASDAAGNAATPTSFTVTVQDTTAPLIVLNGAAVINLNVGDTYTEAGATAIDVVDGTDSVTIGGVSVNTAAVGSYVITYDAVDAAGNNAVQVLRTVNVSDAAAPVITLLGDNPQTILRNQPYVEAGATALDDVDGDLTSSITIDSSAVNTAVAGSYTVTYKVADLSGNTASAARIVNVQDLPPVITLLGTDPVTINRNQTYTDAGATALDDVDGDLTSAIVTVNPVNTAVVGTYVITYDVTDTNGSAATQVTRTVKVQDLPPVITLLGSNPQAIMLNDAYVEAGATALDDVDGDLTSSIVIDSSTVNTTVAGFYNVTYTVTDSNGSTVIENRSIIVSTDIIPPVVSNFVITPLYDIGGTKYVGAKSTISADVSDTGGSGLNTSSCRYSINGGMGWVNVPTAFDSISQKCIFTDIDTSASVGINVSIEDNAGNGFDASATWISITPDLTAPVITLAGSAVVNLTVGDTYTDAGATATDDIAGDITSDIVTTGTVDTATVGTYTIKYNVSDKVGNPALEVSRTVNVSAASIPPTPPAGGGGGGTGAGGAYLTHNFIIPGEGLSVRINNGAASTDNREVTLSLFGGYDATKVSISNIPDFTDADQIDYVTNVTNPAWTLTEGDGVKVVYVKFFNQYGLPSPMIYATINLTGTGITAPAGLNELNPQVLGVQIYNYTRDLFFGRSGEDVKALQDFLISNNAGKAALALGRIGSTGWFGPYTRNALAEFQKSVGIKPALGYFGKITRAYLEKMGQ
ncbi:MAG: immunoglobulin-like domain-containing protein [Patescibacteria group bacterium]